MAPEGYFCGSPDWFCLKYLAILRFTWPFWDGGFHVTRTQRLEDCDLQRSGIKFGHGGWITWYRCLSFFLGGGIPNIKKNACVTCPLPPNRPIPTFFLCSFFSDDTSGRSPRLDFLTTKNRPGNSSCDLFITWLEVTFPTSKRVTSPPSQKGHVSQNCQLLGGFLRVCESNRGIFFCGKVFRFHSKSLEVSSRLFKW